MLAILENNNYNLYSDDNLLVGKIRFKSKRNLSESYISIGEKEYKVICKKWNIKIFYQSEIIYNLKINSFSGIIEFLETKQKITGVLGLKWSTKLVDKENNTQLKIRNANHFINTGKWIIETANKETKDLDVLLGLFGHLYGSRMKMMSIIIVIISTAICSVLMSSGIFTN